MYTKLASNPGSERPCRGTVFNPTLYSDRKRNFVDKIFKTLYALYDIHNLILDVFSNTKGINWSKRISLEIKTTQVLKRGISLSENEK